MKDRNYFRNLKGYVPDTSACPVKTRPEDKKRCENSRPCLLECVMPLVIICSACFCCGKTCDPDNFRGKSRFD
ncbi:MAG: hypothetical protein ACI4S9_05800 [Christensenellales bacterium]